MGKIKYYGIGVINSNCDNLFKSKWDKRTCNQTNSIMYNNKLNIYVMKTNVENLTWLQFLNNKFILLLI